MNAITLAHRFAAIPDDQRQQFLSGLSDAELEAMAWCWPLWARPDQLPPPGDWRTWLLLAGRGAGKTRSSAEWVRDGVESGKRVRLGIIGPTADTIRRDIVEGPSGLLAVAPPWCRPNYEPSTRRIVWPNGAVAHLFSSEEPDRIRGANLDGAWGDEFAAWAHPRECWDMLQMALRIPGPKGDAPRVVLSTTPKPIPDLKAIIAAPTTVVTRARTFDNAANLDTATLRYLSDRYSGSTLGRQELEGEMMDDAEGALWTRAMLDACRVRPDAVPDMKRIIVAIDPAGGGGKANDETGIIVAGMGADANVYVLADMSGKYSPDKWGRRAVQAYHTHKADRIVAERNFGGEMVQATLHAVDRRVPVKLVHASRGKAVRAEPVVSLYEQHRVHHVGVLPGLEDQLTSWEPLTSSGSPDRLDALVWAITELTASGGQVSVHRLPY